MKPINNTKIVLALTSILACGLNAQYSLFYGNLHSHTSYSDGVETPDIAFAYARDAAGLDFLAVTDHMEHLVPEPWNWVLAKNSAEDFNVDGAFVAIAGFEWSSPIYNHCNVFNTPDLLSVSTLWDLPDFYSDILDAQPAFVQFNHPGEDVTLNWNNLAYISPAVDSAFPLIEVKVFEQDSFYRMALDSGWHVAPVANQDNHSANWGTKNDSRAGIWATALTRESLFEAIKSRRVFSTQDKNASVWLELDETPMGSTAERRSLMRLRIILDDGGGEGWSSITVLGAGGTTLLALAPYPSRLDTTIEINPGSSNWIYLKAVQPDGQWIWSAPCFLMPDPLGETEPNPSDRPRSFGLDVSPNPFNSAVKITLDGVGAHLAPALVEVFDLNGRRVAQLPDDGSVGTDFTPALNDVADNYERDGASPSPTTRCFTWTPDETLPSGVYFVRARFDSRSLSGVEASGVEASGASVKRVVYLK